MFLTRCHEFPFPATRGHLPRGDTFAPNRRWPLVAGTTVFSEKPIRWNAADNSILREHFVKKDGTTGPLPSNYIFFDGAKPTTVFFRNILHCSLRKMAQLAPYQVSIILLGVAKSTTGFFRNISQPSLKNKHR